MRFFNFNQRPFKRRRRLPTGTLATQYLAGTVVDLAFEIQSYTLVYFVPIVAEPTVLDISFEIQTPTLAFAPYVLAPPVVNFDFAVNSIPRILIVDTVDLAFEVPLTTTYYPILLSPNTVDLAFEIFNFSKIIVPVVVDLGVQIQSSYTSVYSLTMTEVDLEFVIETDVSTFFSGYFFCVDEGLVTAPGCWEGNILDGITAIGKINCGD